MRDRFTPALLRTSSGTSSDDAAMRTGARAAVLPPASARAAAPVERPDRALDRQLRRPAVRDSLRGVAAPAARDRVADVRPSAADRRQRAADASPDLSADLALLLAQLREHVSVLVRLGRDDGVPIQHLLPEVRCLVREAESSERWHDPTDVIMAHVVRWTIETYYEHEATP